MRPVIAISAGDVYGIGPEVILKAFARPAPAADCRPVVFGPRAALEWHRRALGVDVELRAATRATDAAEGVLAVVDTGGDFHPERVGSVDAGGGAAAVAAIEAAVRAVRSGDTEALVTAPISKEAIALAGSPFTGHTDMLASLCGAGSALMVLADDAMRVGLVTVHLPLRAVAGQLTRGLVADTLRAAADALRRDFAVPDPRIAVLALNPHAGDGGRLGAEEREIIVPAIDEARAAGIGAEGPFAADGFFSAHGPGRVDMIVAMYHDQGLIPFKMQARGRGVNVSCGLPIVRTSPDHGTAFDIAGRGAAGDESMRAAVAMALRIARNRAASRESGLAASGSEPARQNGDD